MTPKEDFLHRLKTDRYQVFLCASRAYLPFAFAIHPWFVVNRKGTLTRIGVAHSRTIQPQGLPGTPPNPEQRGYVYVNYLPPWQGIRMFPFSGRFRWPGKIVGLCEGGEGSVAKRMADFIEQSLETYPYKEMYGLLGPNSNTYAGWVLKNFPESGMRLPWGAFGELWTPEKQ